jgi:hypothetical protein
VLGVDRVEVGRECIHCRILVENPLEKYPFTRPRERWGLTNKLDFWEIYCQVMKDE